jgi:phospholipid/cholesterol/gamma-HCH transport system ATP-binding protein
MIELRNVDFSYEEKPVLRNVSFRVGQGEAVAIMGPSGSGKSTILRLILGLECPQRGEVIIDNQNICRLKEKVKREIRKKIGMVFQDGALFDSLTVGENVGYYLLEHTKLPFFEITRRAHQMLGFVGLNADEIIDKLPEQLSGGMQRRVAIGRALLSTDPSIMLYDEPTTGLDPQSAQTVLNLIKRLHKEKPISTIVVTHQIADALAIADRFIVIYAGEVVFDGVLEQLRDCQDERVRAFLAPFRTSLTEVVKRRFVDGLAV